MSANVVLRKRPFGQGYGMTAQPMGRVRPATTMPASQTSHGPRRVVSSATTTGVPGGKTVSAVWISRELMYTCSSGGPHHQRRTRRTHARPEPACSAGKARARAAGVARWASNRQSSAHATVTRTVACTGPSIDLIQVWMWSYPTSEAVITGSFSITGVLVRTSVPTASLYVISSKVATPQGVPPTYTEDTATLGLPHFRSPECRDMRQRPRGQRHTGSEASLEQNPTADTL